MKELNLTAQVFAILAGLVEERLGIHYGPENRELFAGKLASRVHEAGFESPLDYYYFLRYDEAGAAEFDALTEALVVNETYFFREVDALQASVNQVLAPVARAGRARVLCAACSTGEEPLTLAMLLDEAGLLSRTEIVAVDISARALARARSGIFGARSLRAPPERIGRWVTRERDTVRVEPRLVEHVTWRRLNLVDAQALAELGDFDLVLCRNVLIYFRDETVQQVVASLARRLRPHGRLMVGASESLLRFGTLLRCEERGGAFMYARENA